ncbi:MAG: NUDIX domain-containing protein [Fimbriimonadales bacterium]|nr:NUDIX domain-containing protein [Fimbriimonadales bacterium]
MRPFVVLVFAWRGDRVLVCQIEDRGWCVPSGRIEAQEQPEDAARREALEEGGAVLGDLLYLGAYQIREATNVRWASCFVCELESLGPIPEWTESSACRLLTLDELPEVYHIWNPLTEQVFRYSFEVLQRHRERLRAACRDGAAPGADPRAPDGSSSPG